MTPKHKPTLIIYGATSFTARQLLHYLDTHPEGDQFEFILAGRNRQKLEVANAKLQRSREIIVCQLDDENGVRGMIERGEVVVNLAGPFRWHNAEALIRECCRTGKHYIDLSGESSWLAAEIIPKYDDLAKKRGAIIVPSCGFDSVPSDLSLYLAHKTLQSQYPNLTIEESTSFFKLKGGSMSGGTIQTMHSMAELPKDKRRSGEYDCVPKDERIIRSSTPLKLQYNLSIPQPDAQPRFGSIFFMYPYNRTIIRRSQYLFNTLPSDESRVKYGKEMKYEESMDLGLGRVGSTLFSLGLILGLGLFFLSRWIRKLSTYILPGPGQGVSDEQLFKASYVVDNLSTSSRLPNGDRMKVLTTFKGQGDPGYLSTCYLLAESALSLALDKDTLPPISLRGGMLTPSIAIGDTLVERLNRSGKVVMSSEILDQSGGKKLD
ncbi:hypothetical protein I302_108426 [Kwoniella bestiolae CBS 10118]|uniref:Saccharopine dehydrogenase NADP binding domain-containing protein n=1 Tax=Kwoniella bestiolae CBS 10118 TaxID=1296100 RepID=A0A1B9FVR7_9TREE|nr:hypothetical protein I302_07200 [Kwoniella bestiolae CBS 10118]OCF22855.1 hypothetical protein I302_07200 [Kwoniella bestiolae CBS 10118]